MTTPQRPPSRHPGSRVVSRIPNLVRTLTGMRDNQETTVSRIRREEISFAPADPARGEPATSPDMTSTHITRVYRSGHSLYVDALAWLGIDSVLQLQLTVPELGLVSPPITSGTGGEQDLRLQLTIPSTWQMGEARRLHLQAMRVSGADPTTVRVLRAWQR